MRRTNQRLSAGAFVAPLSLAAAMISSNAALAVEGGISPYLKGFVAFMAGVLPPREGTYLNNIYYHFDGGAGANVRNGIVEFGVDMSLDVYALQGTFVTDAKILGGTYAFGAFATYAWAGVDATLDAPIGGLAVSLDSDGISDSLITPAILGWHDGNFHWNASLSVFAPTGAYEGGKLSVGKNVWGLMPGAAITWFDPESGWDISAAFTYVTTWRNEATDYQSGDLLHLDWGIGKHVGEWIVGITGNVVHQIEGDSGSGANLGPFKAESFGIGPAVSYSTKIGEMPFAFSARWQHDFDAKNTFEGDVVVATATLVF